MASRLPSLIRRDSPGNILCRYLRTIPNLIMRRIASDGNGLSFCAGQSIKACVGRREDWKLDAADCEDIHDAEQFQCDGQSEGLLTPAIRQRRIVPCARQ